MMWNRLSVLAATLLCMNAQAAVLFVSDKGGETKCSATKPCKRIQHAIDIAVSGDSIFIRPGTYYENIEIPTGKSQLTISGSGNTKTWIVSPGADAKKKEAPRGVAADIIVDIFAANVTLENLGLIHPPGAVNKRDIGIFVRASASGAILRQNSIERQRSGPDLEPPHLSPGSRGILVFRARKVVLEKNTLAGNYQDHIHLPTSDSLTTKNTIIGATRLGIVVIQETSTSINSGNTIEKNTIIDSGSDAIQIQGDHNRIIKNVIGNSTEAAIRLCGPASNPPCVAPGVSADAANNLLSKNVLSSNTYAIVNDGTANRID